jgi:hypothetical protein
MSNAPQSDFGRSPAALEALGNRTGVVTPPPDVGEADETMEKMFEEQFGRPPSSADDIPVKDRKEGPEEPGADDEPEDFNIEGVSLGDDPAPSAGDEAGQGEPPAPADGGDAPPKPQEGGEKKSLLDELIGDEAPAPKPKEDEDAYEAHKLAPNASAKARDTFEQLKKTAREREAAAREEAKKVKEELEAARKQLAETQEKVGQPPEELKNEIEELRAFRRAYDTQNDPELRQKFDGRREANEGVIYDVLKKGGLKDAVLDQLKALPYEQRVDHIARWAEKLSPREKLLITSRLSDNEAIEIERAKAIEEAKASATSYLEARKGPSSEEQEKQFVEGVVSALKPVLTKVDILHPKEVPATAAPKEKEAIEQHNAVVAQKQQQLLEFIQDPSPATKGMLALAGILAPHYKAQLKSLQSEVASLQDQLAKIKKAGRFSNVSGSTSPAPRGPDVLDMGAEEALETAWKAMQG